MKEGNRDKTNLRILAFGDSQSWNPRYLADANRDSLVSVIHTGKPGWVRRPKRRVRLQTLTSILLILH